MTAICKQKMRGKDRLRSKTHVEMERKRLKALFQNTTAEQVENHEH